MNVTGSVKYNDQDVVAGEVHFEPDESTNPKGEKGYAVIKNSKYDTADGGKPPSSGAYIVRVIGFGEPGNKPLFQDYREKVVLPRAQTTELNFFIQGPKASDD